MNDDCKENYFKAYGVRNVEQLVVKIFKCLGCQPNALRDFRLHLLQNLDCLNTYKDAFGLQTTEEIVKKVKTLKRACKPSRNLVARANAYVSQKTLLKQNKSLAMSLNTTGMRPFCKLQIVCWM